MRYVWMVVLSVGSVAIFAWLLIPDRMGPAVDDDDADELLDPSDARQLAMLLGMMGGSVADAATTRFALQRFEEIHGRKASTRDVGIVAGLMKR